MPHSRTNRLTILAVVAGLSSATACLDRSNGHRISPEQGYSETDFTQLLRSRVDASIRTSTGFTFKLHRITNRNPASDAFGLDIAWIELPAERLHLRVTQSGTTESDYGAAFEQLADPEDQALLTGGYWVQRNIPAKDSEGKDTIKSIEDPLGLVIVNYKTLSPFLRDMGGGVVFDSKSGVNIQPSFAAEEFTNEMINAIQCKPLLVDEGRTAMISDDHQRDDRLAIGLTASRTVVVLLALHPHGAFTLYELANFLLMPAESNGIACVRALNLDGGPNPHLYVPSLNLHFGRKGSGHLNNIIHLR